MYLDHKGIPDIMHTTGRPLPTIEGLPWKIAVNYECKGTLLVRYLRDMPRIKQAWTRRNLIWYKRDNRVIEHWHLNKEISRFIALTVEEIAFLLGRSVETTKKQERDMFPKRYASLFEDGHFDAK